jgi:hypothetical protein
MRHRLQIHFRMDEPNQARFWKQRPKRVVLVDELAYSDFLIQTAHTRYCNHLRSDQNFDTHYS